MCWTAHTQLQSYSTFKQLWGMCESLTACQINQISRNGSKKKKAVAIAVEKTLSISTTSCTQQPLNSYSHWSVAQVSLNDTAATDSLFQFPIHCTLIPRTTLHMLVGFGHMPQDILSISPTRRSHHSTLCTEESLHSTAKKYWCLFWCKGAVHYCSLQCSWWCVDYHTWICKG